MNKKTYHEPTIKIHNCRPMHMLSGSGDGPTGGSLPSPNMVSAAPSWDFEEDEDDY